MNFLNISSLIENAILEFINSMTNSILSKFSEYLNNIFEISYTWLEEPYVKNIIFYSQLLALALLLIKVLIEGVATYYLETSGDSESEATGLIIKILTTIIIIIAIPELVEIVFKLAQLIGKDVSNIAANNNIEKFDVLVNRFTGLDWSHVILVLLIIIFTICIYIQAMIRGVELVRAMVIGPILALSMLSNNHQAWETWFKQILIICLSQAVQIFMYKGAMVICLDSKFTSLLALLAWLWVTIKTPKWLEQYAYSSGFGSAVGGGVRQMGSMYIMRKMMR